MGIWEGKGGGGAYADVAAVGLDIGEDPLLNHRADPHHQLPLQATKSFAECVQVSE